MKQVLWLALVGLVAASPLAAQEPNKDADKTKPQPAKGPNRLWTDSTGKYKLEAALADFNQSEVRLKMSDGKTVTIALGKLSAPDQRYVQRWADLKHKHPWLDPNAPFDVVAFLEPIPDEENAALVYPDALCEFSPGDFPYLFPPDEQKRRLEIARKRSDEYTRLDEAWRKDPKSVNAAELDAWLAEHEAGFKKLALAQQRPRCMFPCALSIDSLLNPIQASRWAARAVMYRTRRDLQRGDFERPIQGVESVLRLSRDIRYRGDEMSQLVSVAIDSMCCDLTIRETLAAAGLRPEHCDRLLAALTRHEAEASDPFLEGQQVNYLKARKILYDLEHRTGTFDKQYMKEKLGYRGSVDSPLSCIDLMASVGFVASVGGFGGPLAAKKWGTGGSARPAEGTPAAKKLEQAIQAMTADDYAREAQAINRVYGAVLALEDRTMLERSRACTAPGLAEPLRDTNVAVFLEPAFLAVEIQACLRSQTLLRGTQCLVALRRWQFEHRELPANLGALAKAAGMDGTPMDPYCDRPLRMTVIQETPVIYSVGPDGKDDGGLVVWDLGPGHPGDYVFRLTPPRTIR